MNTNTKVIIFLSLILIFVLNINLCFAAEKMPYKPEVRIPGFDEKFVTPSLLGNYIKALYEYMVYLAGILAVIVIMIGGFQWIIAGGNKSKIGEAKQRISSAIIGLFLALGSYLLLNTINPKLVEVHDLDIKDISAITEFCKGIVVEGDDSPFFLIGTPLNYTVVDIEQSVNYAGQAHYSAEQTLCNRKYQVKGTTNTCNGYICTDSDKICEPEHSQDFKSFMCVDSGEIACFGKKEWDRCQASEGDEGYCSESLLCEKCIEPNEYCEDQRQCLRKDGYCGKRSGVSCKKVGSQVLKRCHN